ncbi:MAG: bifunctional folylpolyglutamate synthase/dihydrofolate synthase [Candidatus Merdivicinus sp.]|jgi:dihydrofolate synthase/folylpolyglutamate synthase
MTEQEAIAAIHARPRGGERTLRRMLALAEKLGHPERGFRAFHVAGSNGKGSTAAMIASALQAGGYRTGLYTSPYITCFAERFQIDGIPIPGKELAFWTKKVLEAVHDLDAEGIFCTEFECGTAIAFCWFAAQKCDAAVIETGLGGRNDATNILPPPLVSVITALSLEHTALLGNSLAEIASEKAGILKGTAAVIASGQQEEAMEVLEEQCRRTYTRWICPDLGQARILRMDRKTLAFTYRDHKYSLTMSGRHQLENALNALTALEMAQEILPIPEDAICRGLSSARMPVRFETVAEQPAIVLDGAHNPQGAGVLAELLRHCPESPKIGVIGMLADKDWPHAARILAQGFDRVIAVPVENPRACTPPPDLAAAVQEICPAEWRSSLAEGLKVARSLAGKDGLVCCTGSLFLAAAARAMILDSNSRKDVIYADSLQC